MIDSFQRKILRTILGHMQAMGVWRIKHNEEIYKLYVAVALSTFLHLKAQKWGGQVVWKSDSCEGFRGRRPVGKMGGCCQKRWLRFDPGTKLEAGSNEHHIGGRLSTRPLPDKTSKHHRRRRGRTGRRGGGRRLYEGALVAM